MYVTANQINIDFSFHMLQVTVTSVFFNKIPKKAVTMSMQDVILSYQYT